MSGRRSPGRKGYGHADKAAGGRFAPADGFDDADSGGDKIRLDKWLFFARFFKTRGLASEMITKGRLRINGQRQSKPGHAVSPGDVLTFACGNQTRVIRVLAPGTRRGPAPEAQTLYLDLDPPAATSEEPGPDPDDAASPLE